MIKTYTVLYRSTGYDESTTANDPLAVYQIRTESLDDLMRIAESKGFIGQVEGIGLGSVEGGVRLSKIREINKPRFETGGYLRRVPTP